MVIIIGGGITGLSAAFELTQRNVPFTLLESSSRPGGLIVTEQIDGFVVDGGPDSVLAQKPAAIELCRALGLGARLISTLPPRRAFVLKGRHLHTLPSPSILGIPTSPSALAHYDLLSWPARLRVGIEPLVPRGGAADESVASFFRRRFGPATVHLIAEPLLGGIHAGDVEQLSLPSLFPRLADAERAPGKVLRNLRGGAPDPDGAFRSLRGGMDELVTALVAALPPDALQLAAPATDVQRAGAGWRVGVGVGVRGRRVDAPAIIFASPAPVVASLLQATDPAAAEFCRQVPYASTASVALGWRRDQISHPLHGSGFVVARKHSRLRITACTWVSSKWEGRAPAGHALIRAFLGGTHDPGAAELGEAEIIDTAVRDVSSVLGIRSSPSWARIFRWRSAGAQHNVGHRARMSALAARLHALPGLFVTGSGFDSIGIPDCVAHGRRAAVAAADYVRMEG